MPDTDHPSREDLLAFLVGTLPEETAEIVGSHVDTCTLCQTTLGELDESDDALVAKLRQREGEDPYSSEPQRQMAVERAKAVTPDADDEMTLGQRSTPAHVPNQLLSTHAETAGGGVRTHASRSTYCLLAFPFALP